MNSDQINKMLVLFDAVREGVVTDDQHSELDALLSRDKQACKYYIEYLNMCVFLKNGKAIQEDLGFVSEEEDAVCDMNIWRQLACDERTAPAIEIQKEVQKTVPQRELIQKLEKPRMVYEVNKFSLYSAVFLSVSAMLVVAFVLLFPQTSPTIAYVDEQIGAEWGAMSGPLVPGSELSTGPLKLKKGFARIVFNIGTEVVLEAPADFELVAADQIVLSGGKLTARVPEQAKGFIVQTPTATVVDYGTEFGVEVDKVANVTKAHVFKGSVELRDSSDPIRFNTSERLKAGMAASVNNGRISRITNSPDLFMKELPSEYEMLIRESRPAAYWLLAKSFNNSVGSRKYPAHVEGNVRSIDLFSKDQQEQMQAIVMNPYDGDDEMINLGDVLDPVADSYSLSIWFKPLSLDENRRQFIASKRNQFVGWSVLAIGNDIMLRTGAQGSSDQIWVGNKDSLSRDWHHVVLVIDRESNRLKGYLDGSSQGWGTQRIGDYYRVRGASTIETYMPGTIIENADPMMIGGNVKGCINSNDVILVHSEDGNEGRERKSVSFHGLIYDVAVWKRALSESEIYQLYNKCPLSDEK